MCATISSATFAFVTLILRISCSRSYLSDPKSIDRFNSESSAPNVWTKMSRMCSSTWSWRSFAVRPSIDSCAFSVVAPFFTADAFFDGLRTIPDFFPPKSKPVR